MLNMARRKTLIKSKLNSIPTHVMQVIKLPHNIIDYMERANEFFFFFFEVQHNVEGNRTS